MTSRWQNAFLALQHPQYRLFYFAQLISLIGTWMQSVAQSWVAYDLSHSPFILGLVGFLSQIMVFILAPVAGLLADRISKRSIIVSTQSSAMLLALALAVDIFLGNVTIAHILVFAFLLGLCNAFDMPARQSFIVEIVGKENLLSAIGLNSAAVNAARILGPAIGGFLLATFGAAWCFLLNSLSYMGVIAVLFSLRLKPRQRAGRTGTIKEEFTAGLRFVRQNHIVALLLLQLGLLSLLGTPYVNLMPIFAHDVLNRGAHGFGLLMGSIGIGALIGGLTLARQSGQTYLIHTANRSALFFGLFLIAFSFSRSFYLSCMLVMGAGFCMIRQMGATNSTIQILVPDELRGRVMALYSMMFIGMAPFGAMLGGVFGSWIGAPETIALGGIGCVLGALFFGIALRRTQIGLYPFRKSH